MKEYVFPTPPVVDSFPALYAMCEKRGWFYEGKAKKD